MSEMLDKLSETVGELCKEYGRQLLELRQERDQLRDELAAAKEEADKAGFNLADAKGEIAVLSRKLEDCQAACASHETANKHYYEKLEKALAEGRALAADNERLRRALEPIVARMPFEEVKRLLDQQWVCRLDACQASRATYGDLENAYAALAATPAQSLAAHDAALLERVKARLYALASKEADQPYGHDLNPRQWAATCLECAAEDVAAMQEEIQSEADRIEKEANHA